MKNKFLFALLAVLLVCALALTLTACEKDHVCGHICPVVGCGKCLDKNCKNEACKEKCPGHEEEQTSKYGTASKPLSVEQALALAEEECANAGDATAEVVYATGKVATQPDYSGSYIKQFNLEDAADSTKKVIVYSMNKAQDVLDPDQNDTIVLVGYIVNYSGTIEFSSNKVDNETVYVQLVSTTRGTSTITLGDHEGAQVADLVQTATNGSQVTFTVTADSGKLIEKVTANGVTASNDGNSYTFTIHGDTTIVVDTYDEGTSLPVLAATITFGSQGDVKSTSTTLVEYEKGDFLFESKKASSSSDNRFSDTDHYRCYVKSTIAVSSQSTAFTKLVFTCDSAAYATALAKDIQTLADTLTGVTVTSDGTKVTVEFATATTSLGDIVITAQTRLKTLEIYTPAA